MGREIECFVNPGSSGSRNVDRVLGILWWDKEEEVER